MTSIGGKSQDLHGFMTNKCNIFKGLMADAERT